jgi:four helix bundle protein
MYSLTDQMRRFSRSVAINIREGFAKRKYEQVFVRQLNDAFGSSEETRGWLDFSLDCGYLSKDTYEKLDKQYDEVNAMLYTLIPSAEIPVAFPPKADPPLAEARG